jgi:hypothetical protein
VRKVREWPLAILALLFVAIGVTITAPLFYYLGRASATPGPPASPGPPTFAVAADPAPAPPAPAPAPTRKPPIVIAADRVRLERGPGEGRAIPLADTPLPEIGPRLTTEENADGTTTVTMVTSHRDGVVTIRARVGAGLTVLTFGVMARSGVLPEGEATAEFVGTPIGRLRASPAGGAENQAAGADRIGCRIAHIGCELGSLHNLTHQERPIGIEIGGRRITTLTLEDQRYVRLFLDKVDQLEKAKRPAPRPEPAPGPRPEKPAATRWAPARGEMAVTKALPGPGIPVFRTYDDAVQATRFALESNGQGVLKMSADARSLEGGRPVKILAVRTAQLRGRDAPFVEVVAPPDQEHYWVATAFLERQPRAARQGQASETASERERLIARRRSKQAARVQAGMAREAAQAKAEATAVADAIQAQRNAILNQYFSDQGGWVTPPSDPGSDPGPPGPGGSPQGGYTSPGRR